MIQITEQTAQEELASEPAGEAILSVEQDDGSAVELVVVEAEDSAEEYPEDPDSFEADLSEALDIMADMRALLFLVLTKDVRKIISPREWDDIVRCERRMINFLDQFGDSDKEDS